jgi:hypothetical protein
LFQPFLFLFPLSNKSVCLLFLLHISSRFDRCTLNIRLIISIFKEFTSKCLPSPSFCVPILHFSQQYFAGTRRHMLLVD